MYEFNSDAVDSKIRKGKKRNKLIPRAKAPIKTPLWPEMRNYVFYEFYKIVVPINHLEPMSFLQRLTEDFEYAYLLHKAADITDSLHQLAYVAAFAVSAYSSTADRLGKPFNPVLGETFEFDGTKSYGWRSLAEQVSNKPPTSCIFAQGAKWKCSFTCQIESKFPGKNIEIVPTGTVYLEFTTGNKYSWGKVKTILHDIVHGDPFLDNEGSMDITNQDKDEVCSLTFVPYDVLDKNCQRKVIGCVLDENCDTHWVIEGKWDKGIRIASVQSEIDDDGLMSPQRSTYKAIWKRNPLPHGAKSNYNFPTFANDLCKYDDKVAPTDSRRRTDIRAFEIGNLEKADYLRSKMEDVRRKQLRISGASECTDEGFTFFPTWFTKEISGPTDTTYKFNNDYWDCKARGTWYMCPSIYPAELQEGYCAENQ